MELEKKSFYNIIMNPPYSKNLHLKVLDTVIKNNPNAEIANLSPIRWLQDPLAEYKKNENDPLPLSIKFATKEEAMNFEAYCKLKFPNALKRLTQTDIHVPLMIFPFLDDYTHPWTDEMLYDYFQLTKEERELVEREMKDY